MFYSKLFRYMLAAAGPVMSAGAQFVLSLVLLRTLAPEAFGLFSYLLVTTQFAAGITGALFCAPLPLVMAMPEKQKSELQRKGLFAANLMAAIMFIFLFIAICLLMDMNLNATLLCAGFVGVSSIRWFARTYAYSVNLPLKSTISDLAYSVSLLIGAITVWFSSQQTLSWAFGALAISTMVGIFPFGTNFLTKQFFEVRLIHLTHYPCIWRQYSGWSLLGVLTTEATVNAHVYIVTLVFGAKAFAPLAASALLIRPISVVINALSEFERAQMAVKIGAGEREAAIGSLNVFKYTLLATWLITAVAASLLLFLAPRLLFSVEYDLVIVSTGTVLWIAVAGVRAVRTPYGVLLQAAGEFRVLAFASIISSLGSIIAVTALVWLGGPLWSIGGIILGELLIAFWTGRRVGEWIRASSNAELMLKK